PFVGVTSSRLLRITMDVLPQRLAISMLADSQAALPALPANSAHDGWPIVVIRAVSPLLVGPTPRRIVRIGVLFAFFPPRSETSRRFPFRRRLRRPDLRVPAHWLAVASATDEHSDGTGPTLPPAWSRDHLCRCPAITIRPDAPLDDFLRRWCQYRDCKPADSA